MEIQRLRNMIETFHNESEELEEPVNCCEVYDVMRVLDNFKRDNSGLRKVYKTIIDYERSGKTLSIIFKIANFKKTGDFEGILKSEYIGDLLAELSELGLSNNLIKRLGSRNTYKLSLFGNLAIYQSPFFRVK